MTFCERVTAHPCPTDDEDNKEQVEEEDLMHTIRGAEIDNQRCDNTDCQSIEEEHDNDHYFAIALIGMGIAAVGFGMYAYRRWKS